MEVQGIKTRILLVDDHALFRESVSRVLNAEQDLEVTHCGSIRQALEILSQAPVDVVLLDHDLGGERAWQFLPAARQIGFAGRVLIVTAWVSDTEARRLMQQGASGIFRKENAITTLTDGIRAVASGGTWVDPRYASMIQNAGAPAESDSSGARLNDRERKVLRFVLEGLSNKEIAFKLMLSESYIKAILQRLFQKTGVRTRGQLVRVVLEQYPDQFND